MNNKLSKILAATATVAAVAGSILLASSTLAARPADYGLVEGWTISAPASNDPDVYIVNEPGYKRLFLNPVIFNFYGHLGGFANVHSVSAATRDAFPTSGLFRNCEPGSVNNNGKVYGVSVSGEDTGMLHWVNMSGSQAVAEDAAFFNKVFCINDNEFNWYTSNGTSFGADYTALSQIPVYSRIPGATPTPSASLSVGLSSDNPVAGTLVAGSTAATSQAAADLAHFTFNGSGTVTSIVLKRLGVSADATLANVYLYMGSKRLTDAATVTSGQISFNDAGGLFTVNGSANISVRADIAPSTSGQTVGVQLISFNSTTVSVSGNLFTVASATLADVTLAGTAGATPSANTALDPGTDILVWQNTATVGTRFVWLNAAQFRVIGSVLPGDVQNFRLFVDGVQQGSAVAQADSNGYIVFDLSGAAAKLETGGRILKVLADVINGSGRNFTVSMRQAPDLNTTDSQYMAGVRATATGNFPVSAGQQTISAGTLTITKTTDSPSGDVVKDASGVVLARFQFKAAGERMKVETLRANNSSTANLLALRNGALFADNGTGTAMVQIGSTQTLWEDTAQTASNSNTAYAEYSLGSSLIVAPGTPRNVEIRGDIYDASGTNNVATGQTIAANIAAGSSNVQQLTSLGYISSPSSAVAGNTLTIKTGSFSAGKYTGYANQSVVTPKTGVKLGHFTLTAASSEAVNVNTINVGFNDVTGKPASKTMDVYIQVMNDSGSIIYTSPAKSTVSTTASSSYSVNFTIPVNKTYQVAVIGNYDVMTVTGRVQQLEFSASGITGNSSTSVSTSVVLGQTITTTSGSLTQANGAVPVAQFRTGGTTATGYVFTLTPAFDDFTLNEVYVDLASIIASSTGAVANLQLKDASGTVLANAVVDGTTSSASFTGLNLPITQAGGTKTLHVDVQFANVGVGANDTAGSVTIQLDGLKYQNSSGSVTTTNGLATTNAGNANVVVKAFPTFTNIAMGSVLAEGTPTLFKTSLAANGAQISWNDIVFTVASNSAAGTLSSFKLFENGVDTGATASSSDIGATTKVEFIFATERVVGVGVPVTLELRATTGGTWATGNSINTQITNPAGSTVTTDDSATQQAKAQASASFIWSDQSASAHATTTDDWFTDGLVKDLALSQAITK